MDLIESIRKLPIHAYCSSYKKKRKHNFFWVIYGDLFGRLCSSLDSILLFFPELNRPMGY